MNTLAILFVAVVVVASILMVWACYQWHLALVDLAVLKTENVRLCEAAQEYLNVYKRGYYENELIEARNKLREALREDE